MSEKHICSGCGKEFEENEIETMKNGDKICVPCMNYEIDFTKED